MATASDLLKLIMMRTSALTRRGSGPRHVPHEAASTARLLVVDVRGGLLARQQQAGLHDGGPHAARACLRTADAQHLGERRVGASKAQSPSQPRAVSGDLAGLASMATPLGRRGASRDSSGPAAADRCAPAVQSGSQAWNCPPGLPGRANAHCQRSTSPTVHKGRRACTV